MHNIKQITKNLYMVGANQLRGTLFEGVYPIPRGISYNSYILKSNGENVLFDTADNSVGEVFFQNVKEVLGDEKLSYIVVHHLEPDHSATLERMLKAYPDATVICSTKTGDMLSQFVKGDIRIKTVSEGESFYVGEHELTFVMAPMVHWPEVMMTYDKTTGTLFSADAFGHFASPGGATFADEVNFEKEFMDEARRYYANIVGKYGTQVQNVLKKAAGLKINYVCPLHGFIWRKNFGTFLSKYALWSSYTPEEKGVMIAYGSIYGGTAEAAEILARKLAEKGIKSVIHDVSVSHESDIVADCFKFSHLVFASATYNNGIFVKMENVLNDLAAHNISNRTVALIENGSWAPNSKKLMTEILSKCKNIKFTENSLTIKSRLLPSQEKDLELIAEEIAKDFPEKNVGDIDNAAMYKLSYGLYVLSAKDGEKDNGCIINTATQITDTPCRVSVAVNNGNYTKELIEKTGKFNISTLNCNVPFSTFEKFGFASGREVEKFDGTVPAERSKNGIYYLAEHTNSYISCEVEEVINYDTHTVFVGYVTEAKVLNEEQSVTYEYYHSNIKPKPQKTESKGSVWVCKICGYIYDEAKEGVKFEDLPADWTCPLCKHPKSDFEKVN